VPEHLPAALQPTWRLASIAPAGSPAEPSRRSRPEADEIDK
jgi:hypothetical protein